MILVLCIAGGNIRPSSLRSIGSMISSADEVEVGDDTAVELAAAELSSKVVV